MQSRTRTDTYYQSKYGWFDHGTGVKSDDRKRRFGEVLTPRWLAEMMLDQVPDVRLPDVTVFEPACGEGAFLTCVLRRKLACARTDDERVRACQTCYGIDIQSDNVDICRARLTAIARDNGVDVDAAARIFVRNVIHGDMLFFPMIARFYDWADGTWTTLEDMAGRASCAYMESVAMGENDKKTEIDPRTCPLRDFEGKTWGEIPPEGQTRIFCAYKDYFDTLDRRKRAIGYCVIMGGIAPRHIGIVDAIIQKDACGRRGFGLSIGGRICLMDDARLIGALDDYILNDPRFVEIADGIKAGGSAVAPLFVAAYNGKHESLRDCITFMCKAGKAIGFNARKIRLNHMTDNPIRVLPWKQDDPDLPHKPVGFFGDMYTLQTGDNAICEMRGGEIQW